ncbi:hypothetical protein F5Y12DRAFT_464579 [Xylaria sp. FL1777]|nr:hypothetical protein F5Y12DRAFT_464579 [Xylaria sp. FL1777]
MSYVTVIRHYSSFRWFTPRPSNTPHRSSLHREEPARPERRGETREKTLRELVNECTKPGLPRKWTIVCFVVPVTLVFILFVVLFVEVPAGKLFSEPSALTFGSKAVQSHASTSPVNVSAWLGEPSQTVMPRGCHSHNDYLRKHPLFTALTAGCIGVEADVWLSKDKKDLLVGHHRSALRPNKTLQSMYINPLLEILNGRNTNWTANSTYDRAQGVFGTQPNTTVVLLIDVKEKPSIIWPLVIQQLEPLRQRQFLTRYEIVSTGENSTENQTRWPAPIVVVGSGMLTLDSLRDAYPNNSFETYHDTFLDAPLQTLPAVNQLAAGSTSNSSMPSWERHLYSLDNAHYSSVSLKKTIGSVTLGFSRSQLSKLRTQIRAAKESGLVCRYWDTPAWPINYRDYIWDVLTREGVGILNVDDVHAATQGSWTNGYLKSVYMIIAISVYLVISTVVIWLIGLYSFRRYPYN